MALGVPPYLELTFVCAACFVQVSAGSSCHCGVQGARQSIWTNQWYWHSRGGFLLLGQISGISIREVGFLGWDKSVVSVLKMWVYWVGTNLVSALKRWVYWVGTNQWYRHSRGGFLLLGQISGISTREAGFLGWDKSVILALKWWVSWVGTNQ